MSKQNDQQLNSVLIMRKISSNEFSNYFYRNLLPILTKYEKMRLPIFLTNLIGTIALTFGLLGQQFSEFFKSYISFQISILSLLIGLIILLLAPKTKTIQQQMKYEVLPLLLNFIGSNFKVKDYGVGSSLGHPFLEEFQNLFHGLLKKADETDTYSDEQEFRETSLFNIFNICQIDDKISGLYNTLPVVLRDINLKYITGSGKNRRVKQVFKGLLAKFPMNKEFKSKILVKKDSVKILDLGNRVHLEDPVFEKYFDVYSSDQIEARYVLTTGFMNRLVKIAAKNPKSTISCCFMDGYIYIALGGKDWFDIPASKSFTNLANWQRVLVDFIDLFRIIDELKIEQQTGL